MHMNNIKALQKETLRQLQVMQQLCQDQLDNKKYLAADPDLRQKISDDVYHLANEIDNVSHFQVVLACVGALNAGKSTVINTIIGRDLLPTRDEPMTSVPTLIRHVPDCSVPRFKLPLRDQWIKSARQICAEADNEAQSAKQSPNKDSRSTIQLDEAQKDNFKTSSSGMHLLGRLRQSPEEAIPETVEGDTKVRDVLLVLNDIVRLARSYGLSCDFNSSSFHRDCPQVEVAFHELPKDAHSGDTLGNLCLLDLGGFGEVDPEGRVGLLENLRTHLQRSAGFLFVVDIWELDKSNTEALADIVKKRSTLDQGYIAFNKYDLFRKQDRDESTIRQKVATRLFRPEPAELEGRASQVFPVSAKQGLLSVLGLQYLKTNPDEPLVDSISTWWHKELFTVLFGESWEDEVRDSGWIERAKSKAERLWKQSRMNDLITNVIAAGERRAAFLSMSSATRRVQGLAAEVKNNANLSRQALVKDAEDLRRTITLIQRDIDTAASLEKKWKDSFGSMLVRVDKQGTNIMDKMHDSLKASLNTLFNSGSLEAPKPPSSLREKALTSKIGRFVFERIGLRKVFDPSSALTFADKSTAKQKSREIANACAEATETHMATASIVISGTCDAEVAEFRQIVDKDVAQLAESLRSHLKEGLKFDLPREFALPAFELEPDWDDWPDAVTTRSWTESRSVEGVGAALQRGAAWIPYLLTFSFWNPKWGKEDVTINEHKVGPEKLRDYALERAQERSKHHLEKVTAHARNVVEPLVRNYLDEVKRNIERVRAILTEAFANQQLSEREKKALIEAHEQVFLHAGSLLEDVAAFREHQLAEPTQNLHSA